MTTNCSMLLSSLLLTIAFCCAALESSAAGNVHTQRCRTTDDLGRIPWFLPNTTFHNFGYPLIRTLCGAVTLQSSQYKTIGCTHAKHIDYLYESVRELRAGNLSSTIIVDPHMMQTMNVASSGSYVIMAMFEILFDLGYNTAVRHWSEPMNGMFPAHVAEAAMKISRKYQAYAKGEAENPFANIPNHVLLQIEQPYNIKASIPANTSPYARTYKWIIGFHYGHKDPYYKHSDPTAHCTGANFHLGRGRMCSTSSVIPCPQYDFHRTRSYEVTPESRKVTKKNIILFDDDQELVDMERLKADVMKLGGLDDLQVYRNQGRKRTEMPDFYKQVKMTIDCHNPGVEFINYEATLYDTMTLACDMRATRNVFDFPVPSKYHINPHNWTQFVTLVHDSMINYEERIDDFKHFKRLSRTTSQMARNQVDIHYFSRDVMFRTHCTSYAECRRVYPWAVAVWTLYPMAMIEVVSDVSLFQQSVDNDLVLLTLSELFTSKYFRVYNSIPGVAPVDMFPRTPCAYMVYMDASFIPFGRDFLNTHVAALVKDPRPIVYWQGDKIAIAVMHARPYLRLFQDAVGNGTYVESGYLIHPLADYGVFSSLYRFLAGSVETMTDEYFKRLYSGPKFYQEHVDKLVLKNPPLLSRSCDPASSSSGKKSAQSGSSANTIVNTLANFENTFLRRRTSTSTSTSIFGKRKHKPKNDEKPPLLVAPRLPYHLTRRNHHERSYGAFPYRCTPPEDLIIDALYVPMPLVHNSPTNGSPSPGDSPGPSLWLTSSAPHLSLKTVLDTFNRKQIETIVQHLDPILQNSNLVKILSFIPSDIADVLKSFDAFNYPNVISLRDMEYAQWGEKCS